MAKEMTYNSDQPRVVNAIGRFEIVLFALNNLEIFYEIKIFTICFFVTDKDRQEYCRIGNGSRKQAPEPWFHRRKD
jgi:hypothetical protein